jgi:hypothetical protein
MDIACGIAIPSVHTTIGYIGHIEIKKASTALLRFHLKAHNKATMECGRRLRRHAPGRQDEDDDDDHHDDNDHDDDGDGRGDEDGGDDDDHDDDAADDAAAAAADDDADDNNDDDLMRDEKMTQPIGLISTNLSNLLIKNSF